MRNRSHPRWAALLGIAAISAAPGTGSSDEGSWIEMNPARAAQEALAPRVPGPPRTVDLGLASPQDGAIFSDEPVAHLWGQLEAPLGVLGRVDAVVVIDTSLSTARDAERVDRVRQRVRGERRKRVPSILEHEIHSARLLLDDLDPRHTRLGIVSFAGAAPGEKGAGEEAVSARTEVPVTHRLDALDAGLQRLARRGAAGHTDMAAGLDLALDELVGRGRSRPDPEASQVVVFFTDGFPTLPHRKTADNERAVFEAAERAAAAGVRIFSFAVGPEALRKPTAAVEMARLTDGVFTPVRDPSDLGAAVERTFQLSSVGELSVQNTTIQANALDLHVSESGVFGGLVPLRPGRNRIYVRAVTGNVTAVAERSVHYAPGSARAWIPPERRLPELPTLAGRKRLEITAGDPQGQTLDLRVGGQRKELEFAVGDAAPPAAPAPGVPF